MRKKRFSFPSIFVRKKLWDQGPVVLSPISANPGLTLQVLLRANPGLVLIGLWTDVQMSGYEAVQGMK